MTRLRTAAIALVLAFAPSSILAQSASPTATASPAATPVPKTSMYATGDIYDALQTYALHAGINIYVDPSTPHTPQSFLIRNSEALNLLLSANGLTSVKRGNVLYVGPPAALARYNTASLVSATIPTNASPTLLAQTLTQLLPAGTVIYPEEQQKAILVIGTKEAIATASGFLMPPSSLVYARFTPENGRTAHDLITLYQALYPYVPPNELVLDGPTNTILIRGTGDFLKTAAVNLQALDMPIPQVFYDVSIIEMTPETYALNRGVLFGGPDASGQQVSGNNQITISSLHSVQFNATISMLESQGKAKIERRPSLFVDNGSTGTSQDTTTIPYSVPNALTGIPTISQVVTGIILTATPTVTGNIVHTVLQESYTAETGTGTQGIPITETNAVSTVVDPSPDQTIVISGLLADDDTDTVTGLPPFSHLAFIGGLFRNRQDNRQHVEVVVTLQAHVDYPGSQHLPVKFNAIPDALLKSGIAPAPSPTP